MSSKIVITGKRADGSRFRPGDWVERLASLYAVFGVDHCLRYRMDLRPAYYKHEKCLAVDTQLEHDEPAIWRFVMGFIEDNQLQSVVVSGQNQLSQPVITEEDVSSISPDVAA